jgi:hypothetical protein
MPNMNATIIYLEEIDGQIHIALDTIGRPSDSIDMARGILDEIVSHKGIVMADHSIFTDDFPDLRLQ